MTEAEIMWLAGLIEGEGYMRRDSRSPQIVVKMGDRDVVDRVAALVGGTVVVINDPRPNHSTMYRTQKSGRRVAAIMVLIRPHMGERRSRKIDTILEECGYAPI